MRGRWFSFSCGFALAAATTLGCATESTEATAPPGGGEDDAGADTSAGGGDASDDSMANDVAADAPSGCDPDAGLTISCGTGECAVTVNACNADGTANTCKPRDPGEEICNGKDDDCDGMTDEDLGDIECGVGECKVTQKKCIEGMESTCTPKPPGVEICNGKDDDCDGTVDDGFGTVTCGVGECENTVSSCMGGGTVTCTPKPAGVEICDGKDDDCDGTVDNGPAATLCPPPASGKVATTACESTKCKIAACDLGWADADGDYANGCECADDSPTGKSCVTAYDLSTVAVGTSKTVTHKNPVATRADWYTVHFLYARSNKLASPRATLTMPVTFSGPNPFVLEIQQNVCGGAIAGSCAEGGNATERTSWSSRFSSVTTGTYGQPNFQPFLAGSGEHATIKIKVTYKSGAATTCTPYTLTVSN